jgi:hypothetical protein
MPDLKPGYNWIRTPGTPTLPSCVIASQRVGAKRRPMINSARQSKSRKQGLDCFVACLLISDSAGYINGDMVVRDGGAYLRSSGAEDLLAWTEAQWETQRMARSKDRA